MRIVYHWSDGFMNNEPIRPVFRVLNLQLCHPVLLPNWENMTGVDGQTPLIHGTVLPTSQTMRSSHTVYDYILPNILGTACYIYQYRNTPAW